MTPHDRPDHAAPSSVAVGSSTASGGIAGRISGWFASHPRAPLAIAAGALAVALCAGSVVLGAATTPAPTPVAAAITIDDETGPRSVPETVAATMRARTCVVDASDPAFATLGASVIDAATGEPLYTRAADQQSPTLSAHKIATAAVALEVLGPDTRIPTRVYEGSVKGTVVLVGGGDATLSALPDGSDSIYTGAPRMSDLAAQTRSALDTLYPGAPPEDEDDEDDEDDDRPGRPGRPGGGGPGPREAATTGPDWQITQVVVDTGLWSASDSWDPAWPTDTRTTGTQSRVAPLMVDGDRQDPSLATSPRGDDPVGAATTAFITALDLPSTPSVGQGSAITEQPLLAEVQSQPVSVLVSQMLMLNDNTLAEMLARLASARIGSGGTAASLDQMYSSSLGALSLPLDGITVADGSGLNPDSAASPDYIARLLALAATGHETVGALAAALPVAGVSGALQHRFSGELTVLHSAFAGAGASSDRAASLSGILTAADGSVLALSLQSTGDVTSATGLALETLVGQIHGCGANLSNLDPVSAG